jgi:hypothetical protein
LIRPSFVFSLFFLLSFLPFPLSAFYRSFPFSHLSPLLVVEVPCQSPEVIFICLTGEHAMPLPDIEPPTVQTVDIQFATKASTRCPPFRRVGDPQS